MVGDGWFIGCTLSRALRSLVKDRTAFVQWGVGWRGGKFFSRENIQPHTCPPLQHYLVL